MCQFLGEGNFRFASRECAGMMILYGNKERLFFSSCLWSFTDKQNHSWHVEDNQGIWRHCRYLEILGDIWRHLRVLRKTRHSRPQNKSIYLWTIISCQVKIYQSLPGTFAEEDSLPLGGPTTPPQAKSETENRKDGARLPLFDTR